MASDPAPFMYLLELFWAVVVVLVAGTIRLIVSYAISDPRQRAIMLRSCSVLFWVVWLPLFACALALLLDGAPAAIAFPLELAGLVLLVVRVVHTVSLGVERRRDARWS